MKYKHNTSNVNVGLRHSRNWSNATLIVYSGDQLYAGWEWNVFTSHAVSSSLTPNSLRNSDRVAGAKHRSRIRYLSKKFANFNEFSEIKKNS